MFANVKLLIWAESVFSSMHLNKNLEKYYIIMSSTQLHYTCSCSIICNCNIVHVKSHVLMLYVLLTIICDVKISDLLTVTEKESVCFDQPLSLFCVSDKVTSPASTSRWANFANIQHRSREHLRSEQRQGWRKVMQRTALCRSPHLFHYPSLAYLN